MPPELTPEEIAFFETGDASVLTAAPAPAPAPAPEVAPTPAPEAAPAPAPAPAPSADLTQLLAAEKARLAALEANIERLAQTVDRAIAPTPAAEPDPATDPLGAMMYKLNKLTETVTALQTNTTQQSQEAAQQAQFTEFVTNVRAVQAEYTKTQTDFPEAYKHLRAARADDLRDVGVPEEHIPRALLQDELAVAQNAVKANKNPAEVIYNMAKRYGYTGKPAVAAPAPTPAEKIAALHAGAEAAIAPARAGSETALTFEGLKDAGDSDLNKLVNDDALWAKLVGNTSNDIF